MKMLKCKNMGMVLVVLLTVFAVCVICETEAKTLFPTDLPQSQWEQFTVQGYSKPVCGVIYRTGQNLVCGMPIGSVDTGCVDLELDGTFGYNTIYNSHVPRRGKMNLPFLGLSVGDQSWMLSTANIEGVKKAEKIHYFGHYPVVDLEYETDAPVSIGLRAWTPFIVGDEATSNTPGAIFEVYLRNPSSTSQKGSIVLSFPGPTDGESGSTAYERKKLNTEQFNGIIVSGQNGNLAVGVMDGEMPRIGGSLGADGAKWAQIATALPEQAENDSSASVAVDFDLAPGENKVVKFATAWFFPTWRGAGTNDSGLNIPGANDVYYHMFETRFKNAQEVADYLVKNNASLFKRVTAWQEVLYTDESLPVWLRESLVNILHLITEDGMWAQAKAPIEGWCKPEDGLFGMNESPRDCPQIECIPCSFYGSMPLNYFFPKLAMSTMRGYINYMTYDGAVPWIWGGQTSCSEPWGARNSVQKPTAPCAMNYPVRGYQVTTNGISFVAMADRIWMCSGYDKDVLKELYPWVKKNTVYTINLRTEDGAAGIVSMPTRNIGSEWFEHCEWKGMTAHVGGLHLAQLRIAQRMAEAYGDKNFATIFKQWFDDGLAAMEEYLWNGKYYINYHEVSTGLKSDLIFSYQLDGEWITDFHGLPYCFPKNRVMSILDVIKKVNAPLSDIGFISFISPDGDARALGGSYDPYAFFNAELFMSAMNYMYEGQKDFGVSISKRCMESIVCKHLYTWDMPNMIRGDTGEVTFGKDYYQMLMIWSLPAAITNQDMAGPAKKGGLVDRMIKAAN